MRVELSSGLAHDQDRAASSYRLVEAARVMAEVSGLPDPHEVMGKVKTVGFLSELGASLLGESMVIADNAYEVVLRLGSALRLARSPSTEPSNRRQRPAYAGVAHRAPRRAGSDEELLASFLVRNL